MYNISIQNIDFILAFWNNLVNLHNKYIYKK